MREKTLSFLIVFLFAIGVVCYFVGHGDFVNDLEVRLFARYMVMISFAATPILIISKIFSCLSLYVFFDMRLSTLEGVFSMCYFFLTKEARDKWRALIDEKRNGGF